METKNMVVLIGRLVAEPELRYMPNGQPVANFSIAVNRSIRKDDGSFEDSLDGYFDCELFGGTAVTLAEDHGKGALVQLTGSLHQRKYKVGNGAGNRTVSKVEVRAKTVAPVLIAAKAEAPKEAQPVEAAAQPA
jgi:single-strand DNA-binding protein